MRRVWGGAAGLGLILCLSTSAHATIIDGAVTGLGAFDNGGVFTKLVPPIGSVGRDNFNTFDLFGFDELQNVVLSDPLTVDVGSMVPTGTLISSHYVFFDPQGRTRVRGYVDFDADILGVITGRATLRESDFLGDPSTSYRNPGGRGLEAIDRIFPETDPRRLSLRLRASSPGDYIRVITLGSPVAAPIPEPGTLTLLGAAFLVIAALRLRRRRRSGSSGN